jgi:hypothetical protein
MLPTFLEVDAACIFWVKVCRMGESVHTYYSDIHKEARPQFDCEDAGSMYLRNFGYIANINLV